MARDDGRKYLDRITGQNKKCPPGEVVYEFHEWSSPDGVTWGNTDDEEHTREEGLRVTLKEVLEFNRAGFCPV